MIRRCSRRDLDATILRRGGIDHLLRSSGPVFERWQSNIEILSEDRLPWKSTTVVLHCSASLST